MYSFLYLLRKHPIWKKCFFLKVNKTLGQIDTHFGMRNFVLLITLGPGDVMHTHAKIKLTCSYCGTSSWPVHSVSTSSPPSRVGWSFPSHTTTRCDHVWTYSKVLRKWDTIIVEMKVSLCLYSLKSKMPALHNIPHCYMNQ